MAESQADENCVFCKIVSGSMDTELLYEDENYVSFKDIKPDAPHHYLVIPKRHLPNVKYLNGEQVQVIEDLFEIGKKVLKERYNGDESDTKFGFHWPPLFTSVDHLHMHVLAPESQMGLMKKMMFLPAFFVNIEWTVNYLKGKL